MKIKLPSGFSSIVDYIDKKTGHGIKLAVKIAIIGFVLAIILAIAGLEYTARPQFCNTCHYMRPFYKAWSTSSHNNVPCTECHFPPGIKGTLEGKFKALVQLTKYITRQYGTKPWTEIEDASCLRSGCHEQRLLRGKVDFQGITFDHTPHLTSFRRVTRLRCTSCHSQIVQGTHMTVTVNTCFLCHFKNISGAEALVTCTWCHQISRLKQAAAKFNHSSVLERGVSCQNCHDNIIHGDGSVPKIRCFVCHTEPERIAMYSDIKFMHRNHVTNHKIDCFRCHLEIEHKFPEEAQFSLDCQSCHPSHHQNQKDLYMGKGGEGVKRINDPMFAAHVSCNGCHIKHKLVAGRGIVMEASQAACMSCHGEKYGVILKAWKSKMALMVPPAEAFLNTASNKIKRIKNSAGRDKALKFLEDARNNINIVKYGRGVHNVEYSEELLKESVKLVRDALKLASVEVKWKGFGSAVSLASQSKCFYCHTTINTKDLPVFDVAFKHRPHFEKAGLSCEYCHSIKNKPGTAGHGKLLVLKKDCQNCHRQSGANPHEKGWIARHSSTSSNETLTCAVCHGKPVCTSCHVQRKPASHTGRWAALHGKSSSRASCRTCHSEEFCTRCHGLTMPHPSDWKEKLHQPTAKKDKGLCRKCHAEKFCINCHGIAMPHPSNWASGGHQPVAKKSAAVCSRCHKPDFCVSCHGLQMPHPSNWLDIHKETVARDGKNLCLNCHKEEFCSKCH
ncbi:MAG: NapC/NirT family cytochrome c [Firmicutes bacterium]|nr:NapC/NirT family cytochrome c [Bacillota bacterium]